MQALEKSSRGQRAKGREKKDTRLSREYQGTSPFLGGKDLTDSLLSILGLLS